MARSSEFNQEIAATICSRIADGESLRKICSDEGMPDKSTVFRWLELHATLRDQYTRARETQADTLFEEILIIADDGSNDSYVDDEGMVKTDHDVIARSRLRVDARKWMAGKLRPKVYGEKLAIGGADDLPPIRTLTDEQLTAKIAEKMALLNAGKD